MMLLLLLLLQAPRCSQALRLAAAIRTDSSGQVSHTESQTSAGACGQWF